MLERRFYALSLMDRYLWSKPPSQSPRFERRERVAAQLRDRDGFTHVRPAEPLPGTHAHDLDTFVAGTHGYRHPFVVRGYLRDTPAVTQWSKDHLRAALHGVQCRVFVQDEASRTRSWDQGTGLIDVPFHEFVDRMATEHLYLNNATEVFLARPELVEDLQLERIRRDLTTPGSSWDELVTTNLFVGAPHVFSAVHAAPAGNFFLNLVGRKRWTFVDPRYAGHLHALPSRPFQYLKSAYGGSRAQAELGNDTHPLQMLPRFTVTLEPGDLLYNAPWWWHEVDNLDDFTVGCAVRHLVPPLQRSPTVQNNPIYSLASAYPKFHAVALGHWAKQRVLGGDDSLRDFASELQVRALRKGLSRGRPG